MPGAFFETQNGKGAHQTDGVDLVYVFMYF
jgi:hypothetical protein